MKNQRPSRPLASAITLLLTAVGGVALTLPNPAVAAPVTVDSIGALDRNPSNLTITEVGNISLATARILVSNSFSLGMGGVIDFQQQFQGGTFPNATSQGNGVDVATDSANSLLVTTSSAGAPGSLVPTGPVIFSFYRSDGGNVAGADNIDSNTNQGANIISGGYKSRDPIAAGTAVTGTVDFTTIPPTPDSGVSTNTGGGYMGITNSGSPASFVFDTTPLSFFGITALPRGSSRDTLITLTETPIGGGAPIFVAIGGATLVTTSAVFFGQTANSGFEITGAVITNPGAQGVNRYDDFAFVRSTPEPTSMFLAIFGGMGMLGLARRRRA